MKTRKDGSRKRRNMFGGEGTCPECKIGCGTCFGAGLSNAPREMQAAMREVGAEITALRAEITRLESLISAPRETVCVCGESHPYPLSAPKESE